jgi:energy-converting hydrogenase Eha subunit C
VKPNLTGTLDELVKTTLQCIDQSVGLIWTITQQHNVDIKIDASIKSVSSTVIFLMIVLTSVQDWQARYVLFGIHLLLYIDDTSKNIGEA